MKRNLPVLSSVVFFAVLSVAVVSCKKLGEQETADEINQQQQVISPELHPCGVTDSLLTEEDCNAAKESLKQVKKGTAAMSVPTWMIQGQTRTVTLAVGNAPPPQQPTESQPEPQIEPTSEPPVSQAKSTQTSHDVASMAKDSKAVPQAEHTQTPHDVASMAKGSQKLEVVDYYPFVGKRMSAKLTGDGFSIKDHFIESDQLIKDDTVATWEWDITAKKCGKQTLTIKTNVVMVNSQGKLESLKPTTEYKEISVYIGPGGIFELLKSLPDWFKVLAAIFTSVAALIGAWKSLKILFSRS